MKKVTLLLVSVIIALSLQVQSQTLIAHWPLQGNANDVTVNERHLTTEGTDWRWFTDVDRGQVFESLATVLKLSIPVGTESPLNVRSNFTVSLWVKNSGDPHVPYVFNTNTKFFSKGVQFDIRGGSNNSTNPPPLGDYTGARMRNGGKNYNFEPWCAPTSWSDGDWHHIALTFTSEFLATLYVDGNAKSSYQLPGLADINGTVIEIGSAYGRFSDARMYDSALSLEDINTIMSLDRLSQPTVGEETDILTNSFTANWSAVDNAVSYRVKVYQGGTLINTYSVDAESTQLQVSGLSANTEYSYTVAAVGDGVSYYTSAASDSQLVTTDISTSVNSLQNRVNIEFSYINGEIVCSQIGDIELYNIQGVRLIKANSVNRMSVHLESGIYIVFYTNDNQKISTKLVIKK